MMVLHVEVGLDVLRVGIDTSENDTAMMRILSQSFCEKTPIYPDSRLNDLVDLWCTLVLLDEN